MKRSYRNAFDISTFTSKRRRIIEDDGDDSDNEDTFVNVYSTDNHIYFYSDVTPNSCFKLIKEIKQTTKLIRELNRQFSVDAKIHLHINSNGGCVHSAFGVVDMILSNEIDIYTYIEGMAASAGTIISMVGKKRYITENSFMLVHQLSTFMGGKMMEIEDDYKNTTLVMERIKLLYKKYTTFKKKELDELLKHDLLLDSNKCISVGLVDCLYK